MNQERKKVLEMLHQGKINVDEADELLAVLERNSNITPSEYDDSEGAKFLKILVTENGQEQVNISIPIKLVQLIKNFLPQKARRKFEEEGIDMEELLSQIENRTFKGKLVDIDDGKSHIEIKMVK